MKNITDNLRVVVLDELPGNVYEPIFNVDGIYVSARADLGGSNLERAIREGDDGLREADGIIVRSRTKIRKDSGFFEKYPGIKVIGRAGEGIDNIDEDYATDYGVLVMNTPGANTISVAEHTMGMILALARNIPALNAELRKGNWNAKSEYEGSELSGKVLGIVGLGKIGSEVAKRAEAFGMKLTGTDPRIPRKTAKKLGVELVELDELCRTSDYITVHAGLTERTKGMISTAQFYLMKDGVRVVNCARGGIIDESALAEALKSGKVRGAALDVFETEPIDGRYPLLQFRNVIATPHSAASTHEAQERVAMQISEQMAGYLLRGETKGAVNRTDIDPKVMPYLSVAERMGAVAYHLFGGRQINLGAYGELAGANDDIITDLIDAFLRGFLSPDNPNVTLINSSLIARKIGLSVGQYRPQARNSMPYSNLIRVEVVNEDGEKHSIEGILSEEKVPNVVNVDEYGVKFEPEGYILATIHADKPGLVGRIGTVLGKHRVNIANLSLSREEKNGRALGFFQVDSKIPEEALNELKKGDNGVFNVNHFYIP